MQHLTKLSVVFDMPTEQSVPLTQISTIGPYLQSRLKKWCKAISLLPSNLHYATSLQTLKSLSITCKRWSIVSCVHASL